MDLAGVDLTSVAERVEWAGRHVERLRKLVDAYVSSRPFYVHLSKTPDGLMVIETATLTADPPAPLSLVLGDVAHHLRAALDNLVGTLRIGGANRASAFPIAADEREFDRLAGQMLGGVPEWAIAVIRDLQPFGRDHSDIGFNLNIIDLMAQRDRHRALLLHAPFLDTSELTLSYPDDDPRRVSIERLVRSDRVAELRYRTGSLVRTEYRVRVVVGEDIEGAKDREIVGLTEGWLATMRQVVGIMEDAADETWQIEGEAT